MARYLGNGGSDDRDSFYSLENFIENKGAWASFAPDEDSDDDE